MSSGCRVTNALDISIQISRYTGIFVFWNALPAADSEHRLSQTVHCRPPGMTIAGFFPFVLITELTLFYKIYVLYHTMASALVFPMFQKAVRYRLFSLRDGATIKIPPQKTSSQPSRIVARQDFNDSSERNLFAVSAEIGVYVLDGCPPSAPTDGLRAVVSFAFDIASPFYSIVCLP